MDDNLLGILGLAIGLGICFAGYRLFTFMLPIWGFVAGFWAGAAAVSWIFGDHFLSTVFGWVAGLFLGLVFAILSCLYWYVSVVILAASIGGSIAAAFMDAIGVDSGFLIFLAAVAVGTIFAFATIVLNLPKTLIIILTSFGGASVIVGGLLLLFNQINHDQLQHGAIASAIDDSWFWWIVWAAIAFFGVFFQTRSTMEFEHDLQYETRQLPGMGSATA